MITGYWLLVIRCKEPILQGPYQTDADRLGDYDLALIDPGTEYCIFIDPDNAFKPGEPWAWRKPSQDYRQERIDYLNGLEDEPWIK